MRLPSFLCLVALVGITCVAATTVPSSSLAVRSDLAPAVKFATSTALNVRTDPLTEFVDLLSQFLTELPEIINDLVLDLNELVGTGISIIPNLTNLITALGGLEATNPAALSEILNAFVVLVNIVGALSTAAS